MAVKATTRSRRCHPIPGPEWRPPPGPCLNRPLLPMNLRHHSGLGEMKNPTPRQRTTVRGCRLCLDHDGILRRSPHRVPCVVSCLDCLRVRPAKWRRSLALKRIELRMWIGLVPLFHKELMEARMATSTHAEPTAFAPQSSSPLALGERFRPGVPAPPSGATPIAGDGASRSSHLFRSWDIEWNTKLQLRDKYLIFSELKNSMAEREGFEPSVELLNPTTV